MVDVTNKLNVILVITCALGKVHRLMFRGMAKKD